MTSSGATGTVADTRSAASDLASPASAPNNTSRAPGQPPAPARTDGNTCDAGGQGTCSPDTSTRTRPGSASAFATAPLTSPADRGDNSPDTASTHAFGPRRTCRTVRPEGSDDTSRPPNLDGDVQGQRYRVPAPQTCTNGGTHMNTAPCLCSPGCWGTFASTEMPWVASHELELTRRSLINLGVDLLTADWMRQISMSEFDQIAEFPMECRAYQAVAAVVSDDHNFERGLDAARAVAHAVLAKAGSDGLTEMVVELSSKLAAALERIAAEQGIAAADLADVWFVD